MEKLRIEVTRIHPKAWRGRTLIPNLGEWAANSEEDLQRRVGREFGGGEYAFRIWKYKDEHHEAEARSIVIKITGSPKAGDIDAPFSEDEFAVDFDSGARQPRASGYQHEAEWTPEEIQEEQEEIKAKTVRKLTGGRRAF